MQFACWGINFVQGITLLEMAHKSERIKNFSQAEITIARFKAMVPAQDQFLRQTIGEDVCKLAEYMLAPAAEKWKLVNFKTGWGAIIVPTTSGVRQWTSECPQAPDGAKPTSWMLAFASDIPSGKPDVSKNYAFEIVKPYTPVVVMAHTDGYNALLMDNRASPYDAKQAWYILPTAVGSSNYRIRNEGVESKYMMTKYEANFLDIHEGFDDDGDYKDHKDRLYFKITPW